MFTAASVTPSIDPIDMPRGNRYAGSQHRLFYGVGVALAALMLTACAQQRTPNYYTTEHDSTISDAQNQAQGRSYTRAPAQIQLGFGKDKKLKETANASAAPAAATASIPRPLTEAKSFLGTIPCLPSTSTCTASRMTLTLAPTHEWRARTIPLDTAPGAKKTLVEQGCWSVIGTTPLRISLRTKNGSTKANLTFTSDNVLRINSLNEVAPTLEYHLTRQADIDAIDELSKQPALQCAR